MADVRKLGPTQVLVLCAIEEHGGATTDQVAEYMSRFQRERSDGV